MSVLEIVGVFAKKERKRTRSGS